jgi:hypothetical protein
MQIQFQLSLDDYLAAQRLHAIRSSWPRFTNALTHYIYPILGLCFLVLSIPLIGSKVPDHSGLTMIVCGMILVCCPLYMHFQRKRCYKRTRSDNGECNLTLDEERIGIEGQFTNGEMDWRAVKSFRENKKVFLLYLAPAKFLVVPKRVCTDAQISELRAILSQKIQPVILSK